MRAVHIVRTAVGAHPKPESRVTHASTRGRRLPAKTASDGRALPAKHYFLRRRLRAALAAAFSAFSFAARSSAARRIAARWSAYFSSVSTFA